MIIPYSKLPKHIKKSLSSYIKEKALGYFEVQLFGIRYYLPFTKELKKLLKIKRIGNKFIFPTHKSQRFLEAFLRDWIGSLYLQIRETIGSEIHQKLDSELRDTFSGLFSKILEKGIDFQFDKKLPYKIEEKRNE